MRAAAAHLALALVGLAALIWSFTLAASPQLVCRDAVMRPGDVCVNAEGTQTQTYDQRLATWQRARPVVGAVGVLVLGFGTVLLAQDVRARRGASATPA